MQWSDINRIQSSRVERVQLCNALKYFRTVISAQEKKRKNKNWSFSYRVCSQLKNKNWKNSHIIRIDLLRIRSGVRWHCCFSPTSNDDDIAFSSYIYMAYVCKSVLDKFNDFIVCVWQTSKPCPSIWACVRACIRTYLIQETQGNDICR